MLHAKFSRGRLFASTIICGAAALTITAPALAQDATTPATPDAAAAGTVQEVVVTGSRIPQPNLTAISPVTAVGSQEIKREGSTRIEDLLNSLPQVFADQTSGVSNGATGTATVNLRGLGTSRTLVLIDGRRLTPGDPVDPAPDLNNIPTALVDRIEVDTGGASAVYGSDAIAGVVNFIMKKNFSGVQLDAEYGFYEHDNDNSGMQSLVKSSGYATPTGSVADGMQTSVSAVMGVNAEDGKGNLTAYATYRHIDAVAQSARDYSACTVAEAGSTFACSGSSTTSPARITFVSGTNSAATALAGSSYTLSGTGAATTLTKYSSATDSYNYGPDNYYQRPDTRYNFGVSGHYEINPRAVVYTEMSFMDDDSVARIAPGGVFYGDGANGGSTYTIPCSNSYLTTSELSAFCGGSTSGSFTAEIGKRDVEGGDRTSEIRHDSYRLVTGLKGDLDNVWSYDGYLQYGASLFQERTTGYFSSSKIANALSGCTINTDDGCVAYDLFQGGGITKAQLAYLEAEGNEKGSTTEQVANLTFTGKLGEYGLKSPWADDGVAIALGTEYRRETLSYTVDDEDLTGDLSGSSGALADVSGSFDVYELFSEVRAPLVQNKPWVKSLDLDLAYRFSDYSTAGTTDTYSAGLQWAPTRDIRFRGSFQRAVRAPNVLELYSGQTVALEDYTDPCAGTSPTLSLAQCERTGMTAAQYGSALTVGSTASQNYELTGGNVDLKPEVADTYSGGVVFTPSFIPGFSFSADYFNIYVANVISEGAASGTTIITDCATTGSSYYCGLIHRGSDGSVGTSKSGYVIATYVNAGSLQTSGLDFTSDYKVPLSRVGLDGFGSVSLNFTGTYLFSLISEPVPGSGEKYDCAGFYGLTCETPNPKWRSKVRVSWNAPWRGLEISGQWRYIDSVRVDASSANALLNGSYDAVDARLPAENYFDLTASFVVKEGYTLRFGVNNVFDKDPPLVGADECPTGYCNGNTFPGVYDALGRYMFVGITATY